MRVRWLVATALAYGVTGGILLYLHISDEYAGQAWTRTAAGRLAWAAAVCLASTFLLARRHPRHGRAWMALHAAAAFLLGAAVTWGTVDFLMLGAEHSWDTAAADFLDCVNCVPRVPILRQTLAATGIGTAVAAGLAPLVARGVRPGAGSRPSAMPHG